MGYMVIHLVGHSRYHRLDEIVLHSSMHSIWGMVRCGSQNLVNKGVWIPSPYMVFC
jgi:hypothetical protein